MKYLPGLNTVRFYAAICVITAHVAAATVTPLFFAGWNAVTVFFTLSGYLITYRLLVERQEHGSISLKAFYIRRELRILPLYYLVILFGAGVMPFFGTPHVSRLALVEALILSPQFPHVFLGLGQIEHLWSIGVEEWFYFFWPLLLRRFSVVSASIAIIIVASFLGYWTLYHASNEVFKLVSFMHFESMGFGALAAWLFFSQSRLLRILYHPVAQIAVILPIVYVLATDAAPPFRDVLLSFFVAIFLLNISTNPRSLINLEWRWSRKAGDLSYGIYLWHYPLLWILDRYFGGVGLFVVLLTATLIAAALSYRFIEMPILQLKDRWLTKPVAASAVTLTP